MLQTNKTSNRRNKVLIQNSHNHIKKKQKSHNTNTLYPTIKPVDAMRARDKHTFQRFSIGDVTFFYRHSPRPMPKTQNSN